MKELTRSEILDQIAEIKICADRAKALEGDLQRHGIFLEFINGSLVGKRLKEETFTLETTDVVKENSECTFIVGGK